MFEVLPTNGEELEQGPVIEYGLMTEEVYGKLIDSSEMPDGYTPTKDAWFIKEESANITRDTTIALYAVVSTLASKLSGEFGVGMATVKEEEDERGIIYLVKPLLSVSDTELNMQVLVGDANRLLYQLRSPISLPSRLS